MSELSPTSRRSALALMLSSNLCVSISWGVISPTLIARCLERGSSALVIATIASIWALPMLAAGPLYARIVTRYSARVCLVAGMLADALIVWLFPLFPHDGAWIFLQILTGMIMGHFCLTSEAWLNVFAAEGQRGRVSSLYGIVTAIGYAAGAAAYVSVDYRRAAPVLIASLAMAAAAIPVLFIPGRTAAVLLSGDDSLRRRFGEAPRLMTVAFLAGVLEMVPWSLLQVFAIASGWPVRAAAFTLPVFYIGQVLLTWPVGWMADHTARRAVLLGVSAAAVLCMVALALAARSPMLWFITFLTGGIATGTYTLSLAILGQRFERERLVSANAAFLACYALGTVLGPPAVGALMDRAGPHALPGALGCVAAGILACAAAGREWRPTQRLRGEGVSAASG